MGPSSNLLLKNDTLQKCILLVLSRTIKHFKFDSAIGKIGAFKKLRLLKKLLIKVIVTKADFHEKRLQKFKMFENSEVLFIHFVLECELKMAFRNIVFERKEP